MRRKVLSEVGSPLKTAPSESACTSGQNSKLNVRDLGCYCAGMISLCGRSRVQIGEFFRISERVGWEWETLHILTLSGQQNVEEEFAREKL